MEPKWRPEAWRALADEVRAGRDARGLTQAEFARDAGVGLRTLQDIEAGIPRGRMPRLMPRIERFLGWKPGSARAILDGGSPLVPQELIPRRMSKAHKDIVRYFLENSDLSPTARRALLAQLKEIPEMQD